MMPNGRKFGIIQFCCSLRPLEDVEFRVHSSCYAVQQKGSGPGIIVRTTFSLHSLQTSMEFYSQVMHHKRKALPTGCDTDRFGHGGTAALNYDAE